MVSTTLYMTSIGSPTLKPPIPLEAVNRAIEARAVAVGTPEEAINTMRVYEEIGADQVTFGVLSDDTPFDAAAVKATLAKLRTVRELRRENLAARHGGYRQETFVEGLSQIWLVLKTQIAQVAPSQAPVLIQGETGSGKEVVARLLHTQSRRANGPCIAVNCGAVSRELLESELFGYEKGAFTGATSAKPGLIAAADGGSLFLDEVGEMPGPMQVSLLRFLDRNEYRPVGSARTLRASPGSARALAARVTTSR